MCVYNEDTNYIRESVESILNQTYNNFEFIIVCDNPADVRVLSIIDYYRKKDHRIVCLINEENVGLTRSLNVGLRQCHGEYVARMDADDISYPNRLELQLKYLNKNPQLVACGSYIELINENGNLIGKRKMPVKQNEIDVISVFDTPLCHPTVMFRRVVKGISLRYDEDFVVSQDFALWSTFEKGTISNVKCFLLKYRISNDQISNKRVGEQMHYKRLIQYSNLNKNGIVLDVKEKRVFDYLFSHGYYKPTEMEIKALLVKLYKLLSIVKDAKYLGYYIINCYITNAVLLEKDYCSKIRKLFGFSRDIKYLNAKSILFLLYKELCFGKS